MKNITKLGIATSLLAAVSVAIAMGPLDPPAGPVTETSPSLADLESLIQSQADGPWQVKTFDSRDGLNSQNNSIEIAPGQQVLLHSINAFRASAYAFDGSGQLSGQGTVNSGTVVGQVASTSQSSSNSEQAICNVLCENGLEIAWTYNGSASYFIQVYYKVLN